MKRTHRMIFPQYARGRTGIEIQEGTTILEHIRRLGIGLSTACGGRGECGKCVVRVDRGLEGLTEQTEAERSFPLAEGERLACQARVASKDRDIYVFIREAGEYTILSERVEGGVPLDPFVVRKGDVVFWGDMGGEEASFRTGGQRAGERALGPYKGGLYGAAIDVGTTTLVVEVLDLESGERVATLATKNPQAAYGDDVISRIGYTDQHEGGLTELQQVVVEAVNSMLSELEERTRIYEAVVVGNCTMRNLFFGLDVHSLGTSPYEPEHKAPVNVRAEEIGLRIHPRANVYGAPLVAGQVGADCLAVILACELYSSERPCMAVDIGTNGEVAVGSRARLLAASNAAGGAFEGGTVTHGTGAIEGAIKNVHIQDGRVRYETIGDKAPMGICGSGLIDLLAEMLRNGIIDANGRFAEPYRATNEFVLVRDGRTIGISQKDINELRLARAGSALNQQTLMGKYGVDLDGLDRVYLAGGFGNYVDLRSATAIGILPDRREKLVKVGNAALTGATQMLLSRTKRRDAERIAGRIEHVKLSEEEGFLDRYVQALSLGRWPR